MGIELEGLEGLTFESTQYTALVRLCQDLRQRYPVADIAGHEHIAPGRKQDPGPRFPWQWLANQGIGAWYDNQTLLKYWQGIKAMPDARMVQRALQRYGYGIVVTGEWDLQSRDVLLAFQRHFVPNRVSGELDPETVAVLWALLEKYFPDSLNGPENLALTLE